MSLNYFSTMFQRKFIHITHPHPWGKNHNKNGSPNINFPKFANPSLKTILISSFLFGVLPILFYKMYAFESKRVTKSSRVEFVPQAIPHPPPHQHTHTHHEKKH